ncbi:ankyrin repeat-containing protein itn1 [Quercus suber]|uniref:Ankyrin repeat-containing protein itn1 n=1 Tax=Quercus suber TaxID=58331 RepID=A0AAW0LTP9_QUESU
MATHDVNLNDDITNFKHEAAHAERSRLHLAALKGDWNSIEDMPNIQREITKKRETTLHIAAAANQEEFVKNLVEGMSSDDITAENTVGSTALAYAAATGNVNIAKAMLKKNRDLPNLGSGMKPLLMAALLEHYQMVEHLSRSTRTWEWDIIDQTELFVTYARVGYYGQALEMMKVNSNLATAKNRFNDTALHDSKQIQAHELVKEICVRAYDVESLSENQELSQSLFAAAEVGNVEFLIELIRFDLELALKTDQTNRSIFHIAVKERHESIFSLLHEIGSFKDLIVENITNGGNNMLHLAAKLAPQQKLNAISGAALQLQQELLWFKEVEMVVKSSLKEMKNEAGETPYVLFATMHEELRKDGENWMRNTANSSMVVATLICSIIFAGQPTDGIKHSSENSNLELAFSVSSTIALFCSSTSLIMFLSILTSRYSYNDFLVSLPIKLMIGVASLFI